MVFAVLLGLLKSQDRKMCAGLGLLLPLALSDQVCKVLPGARVLAAHSGNALRSELLSGAVAVHCFLRTG